MNSFVLLMSFVLQRLWIPINADDITTPPSPPPNIPMLGKSPCMYSGSFDPNGIDGLFAPMPVSSLPLECSSFIYDGIICDENLKFNPSQNDINNMNNLISSRKKLYIYYSHGCLRSWMQTIDSSAMQTEAINLKNFLSYNLASGLILKDLNYIYDGNLDYHLDPDFSKNLRDYVIIIKERIPDLKIGLYVNASNIIYYSSNPKSPDWFDFTVLNDYMDFYVIGFDKFNPCNDNFRGGIVPINDICGIHNSLTKLSIALYSSMIEKDKMYIEFLANPSTNDTSKLPVCAVTYEKICKDSKYMDIWCADNSDSFYDKGKFANEQLHAQGIITKYIDAIDPNAECECDSRNQFITFKMMLRGFLEASRITDCLKLNSIAAEKPKCEVAPTTAPPAPPANSYVDYFYNYFFSS